MTMPSWFCPLQKGCIIRSWHECFCLFAALSFNSVNYWRPLDMFGWNSIKKKERTGEKERDDMQHKEKPPFTVCDACSTGPAASSAPVCNSQPTKGLRCFKTQPHPSIDLSILNYPLVRNTPQTFRFIAGSLPKRFKHTYS